VCFVAWSFFSTRPEDCDVVEKVFSIWLYSNWMEYWNRKGIEGRVCWSCLSTDQIHAVPLQNMGHFVVLTRTGKLLTYTSLFSCFACIVTQLSNFVPKLLRDELMTRVVKFSPLLYKILLNLIAVRCIWHRVIHIKYVFCNPFSLKQKVTSAKGKKYWNLVKNLHHYFFIRLRQLLLFPHPRLIVVFLLAFLFLFFLHQICSV